ncbi:polyprenyl synthetase family protein [Bradyrhizobium sp.]|jgi:geranylgeranyl pyrophosphate synthase|uniref:polyprenyl synthetase family protein n=1 Tax=Bradyrhizobium sp. TaxID=376 RepID=UPI003C753FF1
MSPKADTKEPVAAVEADIGSALGFETELKKLQLTIARWVDECNKEMDDCLRWQFSGKSKYFRPVTVFACFRAMNNQHVGDAEQTSALVIELIHNMTLIVDDILDKSEYRRGKLTLHCQFGLLPALMTSGYIVSEAYRIVGSRPASIQLLSELIGRLGIAECLQWRVRSQPLGVEDWRQIAGEDTGSMFEVCACLGGGGENLRRFGRLLGMLYHGCDDVADVRGVEALGGGGDDDIRDGILTLPAAIAIRNPETAAIFCNPDHRKREVLAVAFRAALPEAEQFLDEIAAEACREATKNAPYPQGLLTLVDYTRGLSRR